MNTKLKTLEKPPTVRKNDPNNVRLRKLIAEANLTQERALELFNEGMVKPYKLSSWKAFLAVPSAVRWRRLDPLLLSHAEKKLKKKR